MQSFSGLIEFFIVFLNGIFKEYILYPLGNEWIVDSIIYHLIIVLITTSIFSLIFNKWGEVYVPTL